MRKQAQPQKKSQVRVIRDRQVRANREAYVARCDEAMRWCWQMAELGNLELLLRLAQHRHDDEPNPYEHWDRAMAASYVYCEAAFPGFWDAELSAEIMFLEADPYFFRSGYRKEKILRRLKKAVLSDDEKERLRRVVLVQVASSSWRREFSEYARLAIVLDSPALRQELATIGNAKAHHVLALLAQAQHQLGTDKGILGSWGHGKTDAQRPPDS